jgi:alpha-tubulin suppressor-like RCC1 family protein
MLSPLVIGQPGVVSAATGACNASTFTAGGFASAGISNGALYMWGNNGDGQLGVGFTSGGQPTPLPVVTTTGLTSPTAVSTWGGSSFAVDVSGQLWGWGDNHWGELAKPSLASITSPTRIAGPNHVVQASSGGFYTLALTADGTVWGWGTSFYGGLGFVQQTAQTTPVVLPALSHIVEVSAGPYASVALKADGTVYGAGQNMDGELGLGSGVSQASTFQPLPGLSNVTQVVINESGNLSAFVVAVDQGGHVFAAGNNREGEMGRGAPSSTNQVTFAQVPNLDSVVAVAAGDGHILALKSDGTVWAWGYNPYGQLGDGTVDDKAAPIRVSFPAGTQLVNVAAGFFHSMALDSSGNLWSWGANSLGELGTGTAGGFSLTPVKVRLGPVGTPCVPLAKTYLPSVNGYAFQNDGIGITSPTYGRMAEFYSASKPLMYIPFTSFPTGQGLLFYYGLFKPFYVGYPLLGGGGLCYGMSASNQFLFNTFPDKSAFNSFSRLQSQFTDSWGPSPSPGDATVEDLIDRYHSRQLAASGAIAAIDSWNHTEDTGGNRAALDVIAAVTDTGKTEWVGLGPARSLWRDGIGGKARFLQLFNDSHAVLAYGVDRTKTPMQIKVYDPNAPNDDHAYIQIVDDASRPGGGIRLVHNDDPQNGVSYGGGIVGKTDYGQPTEWTLMPLQDGAFTNLGIVPGQTNQHWVLDAAPLAWLHGARTVFINGIPVFKILGAAPASNNTLEMLPSGTGFAGTVTADTFNSQTSQMVGSHGAQITQTDASAAGTSHQVVISPDATEVTLSNASATEQYTVALDGDFLSAAYGRRITLSGATLAPGSTLDIRVDPAYSSVALSVSGVPDERANLLLEQLSQFGGSANVTALIPGKGTQGNIFVADWANLASSLIFEVVTTPDGNVTGLILQDNPAQRQALLTALLQTVGAGLAQISDLGIRNSLQSKVDNAIRQAGRSPAAAANMLEAMRNEIAAQSGKAIDTALAASLDTTLRESIGLLRATMG